jgi:hypothetical protein
VAAKVGLTVLGSAVGEGVGATDGPAVGFAVGEAVGIADGFAVGVLVGLAVGLALGSGCPSTSVNAVMIFTVLCDVAQPPIIMNVPEPAAGVMSVPAPSANLLLPVQEPPEKDPLDVSNTYSQLRFVRLTVRDSPG